MRLRRGKENLENKPSRCLLHTLAWASLILEQIALQRGDLFVFILKLHPRMKINELTLNSSLGIASAKRLARTVISSSDKEWRIWEPFLRLGAAKLLCEAIVPVASLEVSDSEGAVAAFFAGKKHWKMPSACHFVAFLKLIQTSIRPGRLSAGSKRSM